MICTATIRCDRCGVEIDATSPELSRVHALCGPLREGRTPALDLCPKCAESLKRWIAEGADRSAGPKGIC